jgi:hypothetical protein
VLKSKERQLDTSGFDDILKQYIASNIQIGSLKIWRLDALYIAVSNSLIASSKVSDNGSVYPTIVVLRQLSNH